MSINKIILIGRLGADPETRQAQSGKAVTKFRIATDSGWGDNKTTDWHNIVTFDRTAEACAKYLTKGRMVYVEGRVSYRKWDKEDGTSQWFTDIIANDVQFLGGGEDRPSSGGSSRSSASYSTPSSGGADPNFDAGFSDADIPF